MKDIKAILANIEIEDDAKLSIIKAVNENYRSIEEMNKKAKRIEELEQHNATLTEQVGNLEGDGEELEKLREQVKAYADADEKRKADEQEQAKRDSFRTVFDAALGEREFANSIVRDSIFNQAYEKCSATAGLNAKDVIDEIAKDADGVWKNPQHDVKRMPDPANISTQKNQSEETAKREIANFLSWV